jgi:hypothetical protein
MLVIGWGSQYNLQPKTTNISTGYANKIVAVVVLSCFCSI